MYCILHTKVLSIQKQICNTSIKKSFTNASNLYIRIANNVKRPTHYRTPVYAVLVGKFEGQWATSQVGFGGSPDNGADMYLYNGAVVCVGLCGPLFNCV